VAEIEETAADAVVVAYVHSNNVTYSWHHSMIELVGWDLARHGRVIRGGYLAMRYGTDGISLARNKAALDFLAEKEADWLFWVDTDMGFPADIVDRLMEAADPIERPIVGALAFSQREEVDDGMGGFRCRATPTIFDWVNTGEQLGFGIRFDYPADTLLRCGGTGSACILIHRSVFERIEAKYGRAWYDRVPNTSTGQILSEDLSFCLRAGTLDIPVYVHTGIKTSHLKQLWLSEDDYYGQRALAQLVPPVPAAIEATAVIVPVLGRPQNAEPFMESLKAASFGHSSTDPLVTVYAVVDASDGDTEALAWVRAGARVIDFYGDGRPGTFAEKVNDAYKQTDEPWLFLVGDDVQFYPGWLDQAQHAARDGAHVIGTNDLHNPLVLKGEHATHLLVRRNYVDERGASWDGPKVVCHEGYRHMFVDNEVVETAKQRKVWAFAHHSKVEHLHPLWGLAEGDETYRLGAAAFEQDKALFEARLAEYG
jgi:hypothetical protein